MTLEQKKVGYRIAPTPLQSCKQCEYFSETEHRWDKSITHLNCRLLTSMGSAQPPARNYTCNKHQPRNKNGD